MWQELARLLALLIKQYQRLQSLGKEKHGVLVGMDMKKLAELVEQEEKLLKEINQTEKQRQQLLGRMADSGIRVTPAMQMSQVWEQCPDRGQRDMLYKLHKMLAKLVQEVQDMTDNNEIMIRSALDVIGFRLNQLGGSVVEPAYGSRGQEQVTHRKNFDLEV